MGRRKGKSVRKNKRVGVENEEEDLSRAPHSFVVHRGKTGKFVQELANDFRRVMEPYTATNIKVRPKNVIKDFVHVAGLLKVSHLAIFTKTLKFMAEKEKGMMAKLINRDFLRGK